MNSRIKSQQFAGITHGRYSTWKQAQMKHRRITFANVIYGAVAIATLRSQFVFTVCICALAYLNQNAFKCLAHGDAAKFDDKITQLKTGPLRFNLQISVKILIKLCKIIVFWYNINFIQIENGWGTGEKVWCLFQYEPSFVFSTNMLVAFWEWANQRANQLLTEFAWCPYPKLKTQTSDAPNYATDESAWNWLQKREKTTNNINAVI